MGGRRDSGPSAEQQIASQTQANQQQLELLQQQQQQVQESQSAFIQLLQQSTQIQEQQAEAQAQEVARAEGRQDEEERRVSTSLLDATRDVLATGEENRRRRRAGAQAPVLTGSERLALLQR